MDRIQNQYATDQLALLTTAQLEGILQLSIKPGEQVSEELVVAAAEELLRREPSCADPERARRELAAYWNTPDGVGQRLYDCEAPVPKAGTSARRAGKYMKRMLIAAVLVSAIVLTLLLIVGAQNEPDPEDVVAWTDDFISFHPEAGEPGMAALRAAMREKGFSVELAPTVLPAGYSFEQLCCTECDTPDCTILELSYSTQQGSHMYIQITRDASGNMLTGTKMPKDVIEPALCIVGGREFSIFGNEGLWNAVWSDGTYMIQVCSARSEADIYAIVGSIGVQAEPEA